MHTRLAPRLIPALIALSFSGSAAAAGFQLIEQNASGIGNAYAGSAAVAENASTIFYNPAGMTQLQAREFSVGLSLVRPSFNFSNKGSVVPALGPVSLSGDGGDGGSWAALPNAYMSWALNKDVYLGVGLGAPFGLMTEYDKNWLGAAHSIKFDIKTYNINPSIAWRVNDKVSLGAGINYMLMDVEYIKRAGAATVAPIAKLQADDTGWGWNIGALFTLSESTKLGLSYRSKVKQKLDGDLTVVGVTQVDAQAKLELPDTAIVSLTHKLNDKWELLGDVSWTGWSSIPKVVITNALGNQTLDTKFDDSWRVALGANYALNPTTKLKFGVAYDQTPVPDAEHRLVSLPDNDRLWLSLGAQWKPSKATTVDLGASYLFVKDTKINNNGGASGLIRGDYDSDVWILGGQFSMAF
ncbi:OmpP1/FadL family transporter [Azonexus caeni]|jgi:long-chain fatty acid transport protein|uniref:OmpP1/FadL family transporter n=1 Tax=Azonexus caeni TaxID=266126 RepID=UPI003A89B28A